ncbi:hypothetical protein ACRAWD_02410 [Caulobacter segnis]
MLGYPVALAETLPKFVNDGFRQHDEAAAFAEVWLARTLVGADLSRVVSQLCWSFSTTPDWPPSPAVIPTSNSVGWASWTCTGARSMARCPIARPGKRCAWRRSQPRTALATCRSIARQAMSSEAAAWPGTMRTVLRDTLSARGTLDLTRSLAEIGWTMENESQVFHIREQAEKGRLQGGAVRPGSVVRDPRRRSSGPRERIPPAAKADGGRGGELSCNRLTRDRTGWKKRRSSRRVRCP